MHCQLDELNIIFDVAGSARDALRKGFPGGVDIQEFSRRAANITFGLLLLENYDVFIKQGIVNLQGKESPYYWVELYLTGEAFVLDAVLPLFAAGAGGQGSDIIFLPFDEAAAMHGYAEGGDYEWRQEDCEEAVWETVLKMLNTVRPLGEIMEEISGTVF